MSMEINIEMDKQDWKNFQSYIERELPRKYRTWMHGFWVNQFIWIIVVAVSIIIFQANHTIHWPTAILISILFILIFVRFLFKMNKIRKAFEPLEEGFICGSHKFVFNDYGIETEGNGYNGQHSWKTVKSIERARGMIMIFIDTSFAFVFPESKLDNPDAFYIYIVEQFTNATSGSTARS